MKKLLARDHEGQVLVWVAVAMVALLALISVAVDGGYVYSQRRLMQNAADAGALAGAWEICYGTPANAVATAHQYAEVRNRADPAMTTPTVNGQVVTVRAGFRAQTIFARVVGINSVDVYAQAAAKCGKANAPCAVWPIGYNIDKWENLSCGQKFILWNDENKNVDR